MYFESCRKLLRNLEREFYPRTLVVNFAPISSNALASVRIVKFCLMIVFVSRKSQKLSPYFILLEVMYFFGANLFFV